MSSVVISGDTSGAITLAAPAVAGTNTINLPAAAGTVMVSGNMPAFSAYANNQSINNATVTTVQFTVEDFDTANCFNTSTYRYTPNVAGYYWFSFTSNATAGMTGETFAYIEKNGSGTLVYDLTATLVYSLSGGCLLYANGTTDYFTVSLYQSSGVAKTFNSSTKFYGYLVRAA